MKAVTKITFLDDNGEKFFGEGPSRLLRGVEEHGSLRAAAMSMDMAYTKALKLLRRAEEGLGCKLLERRIGGAGGGGSVLTDRARMEIDRYEGFRRACCQAADELFAAYYGQGREQE
jgi:molybdate transport system regulatory protein